MNNKQTHNLSGKTALVTGGTKGIGRAIANTLAEEGAKVIVSARNRPDDLNQAYHFIAADLTNAGDVARLASEINEQFGGIDILINNAGGLTSPGGGFSTLTDENWENELHLNLISATRLDRALLPKMIDRKSGVIIHISSVSGKQPLWYLNMPYAASKAALNSYSKSLSSELASKGIRVLTVSPGATKTPPMQKFVQDFATNAGLSYDEGFAEMARQVGGVPMGRMAEPEEVGSLVAFLVSPAAAYLTGANYTIDGGSLPTSM